MYSFVCGIGPLTGFKSPELAGLAKDTWNEIEPGIKEFASRDLNTPVDLRSALINRIVAPVLSRYGTRLPTEVEERAQNADLILVESGVGAAWLDALSRISALDRTIYFAADDVRTIRGHPLIRHRVSTYVPSCLACVSFGAHEQPDNYLGATEVTVLEKGIDLAAYEKSYASPYGFATKNVVCVGEMLFDAAVLPLAESLGDVQFHFFGSFRRRSRKNIVFHGSVRFAETIPFVKFAHAGLLPYRRALNVAYLATSSMKLAQFRACGLPVVGPCYLKIGGPTFFPYNLEYASSFKNAVVSAVNSKEASEGHARSGSGAGHDYRSNWKAIEELFRRKTRQRSGSFTG